MTETDELGRLVVRIYPSRIPAIIDALDHQRDRLARESWSVRLSTEQFARKMADIGALALTIDELRSMMAEHN